MKSIITTISLFLTTLLVAQVKTSIETLTGYESNIYKAPDSYILNNVLKGKNELYESSLYQEGIASVSYREKISNGSFKLFLTPEIRYYFSEPHANRIIVNAGARYRHKFTKALTWESNLRYKLKNQEGEDLDQAELSTPLGYNSFKINTGIKTKLYKNNKIYVRASFDLKKFDKSPTRKVSYNKYGIYAKFQHKYPVANKKHNVGFKLAYYHRDYTLNYFDGRLKNRNWNYINAGVFYSLPLNRKIKTGVVLDFEQRIDATNNKYGYNQIRPSAYIKFKQNNLKGKVAYVYTNRTFKTLQANSTEQNDIGALTYKNSKFTLSASYKLTERINVLTDNYFFTRNSTTTDINTTAYRSYEKYYTGIGVKYNF